MADIYKTPVELRAWAEAHLASGLIQARQVLEMLAENERLKRGDFTEEEFQNLCHNFTGDDAERFKKGCEEYQKKLFCPR